VWVWTSRGCCAAGAITVRFVCRGHLHEVGLDTACVIFVRPGRAAADLPGCEYLGM